MTRHEMLKQLGLTDYELKDLLKKFDEFHESLNEAQQAVIDRSLPTTAAAARKFGQKVTTKDLETLFTLDPVSGIAGMRGAFPMANTP